MHGSILWPPCLLIPSWECALCCASLRCSLRSRGITHADRRHLPIICVAHSFSTLGIHCSLCSARITHADRLHLPITHVACSFSRHTLLRQNHTRRQAWSAHHSCCSLIQRSRHTLLTQNHRQASTAHRSRCSLIPRSEKTLLASLAQNQRSWNSTLCPPGAPPGG